MSEEQSAPNPRPRKRSTGSVSDKPKRNPVSQEMPGESTTTSETSKEQQTPELPIGESPPGHHKKHKLVRDSFKFPPEEYAVFAELKRRCSEAGREVKKGELVRAGLMTLKALSDKELLEILNSLQKLKTGRPAK